MIMFSFRFSGFHGDCCFWNTLEIQSGDKTLTLTRKEVKELRKELDKILEDD